SVLSREPGMAVAHYPLGGAFSKSGDLDHASAEWQQAIQSQPEMLDPHRSLANFAFQKGVPPGLEHSASEIIRLQPANADAYAYRAFSLMARKQYPAAEMDARKAIQTAPQSAVGYLQMGNLNAVQHKLPEAENWFKQSLSRDPNSV